MKITKKQPLRPRGRSDEKRQSTKDAIREAYANGPQKEVQIIPAKKDLVTDSEKKKLRVCAYCRVSTDDRDQRNSLEAQVAFFHFGDIIFMLLEANRLITYTRWAIPSS